MLQVQYEHAESRHLLSTEPMEVGYKWYIMLNKPDEILVTHGLRDGLLTVVAVVENATMSIINAFEGPIDINMKVKLWGVAFCAYSG